MNTRYSYKPIRMIIVVKNDGVVPVCAVVPVAEVEVLEHAHLAAEPLLVAHIAAPTQRDIDKNSIRSKGRVYQRDIDKTSR